ncbi:MAG TPA: hypothetical protein VF339_14990 [Gammaproteobacteria bacterium]
MEIPRIQLPSEVERCIQQGGEDCDGEIDNLYGEWWSPGGTPAK